MLKISGIVKCRYFKVALLVIWIAFFLSACGTAPSTEDFTKQVISYTAMEFMDESSSPIRLLGRYSLNAEVIWFDFTLSGMEFSFTGTKCVVQFCSDFLSDDDTHAIIGVFYNDLEEEEMRLVIDSSENKFTVFEAKENETVKIKLVKLSEAKQGTVGVKSLTAEASNILPHICPTKEKERLFLFIGDSITCGMGNETNIWNKFTTLKENGNMTYGAITARNFEADVEFVSYSGIGLIWGTSDEIPPMPEMIKYSGYTRGGGREPSLWKNQRMPDVICINLGTNDAKHIDSSQDMEYFEETYAEFLTLLRQEYSDAYIIVCYGPMNFELQSAIQSAFYRWQESSNDQRSSYLEFGTELCKGSGVGRHPTTKTHKNMATVLTTLLEVNL